MILLLFSDKNLPRFTTEQETLLLILNEKLIFNTKPLYEAEGIEPLPKHHDLYKKPHASSRRMWKIKILKSINSIKNKIK